MLIFYERISQFKFHLSRYNTCIYHTPFIPLFFIISINQHPKTTRGVNGVQFLSLIQSQRLERAVKLSNHLRRNNFN